MAKLAGYLWKRNGIWISDKDIKGQPFRWSTKTGDKATAERRARDHWQQVVANAHALVDRQASRRMLPSFAEVRAVYLAHPGAKPNAATRRQNWNMLTRVIALGVGRYAPDMSIAVLDADVVRGFQAARLKGIVDLEERERAKFSANSMLTQARSVFRSVKMYEDAGYKLPDLVDFLRAERFRDVAIDTEFRPFSQAELTAITVSLAELRMSRPALFAAAALMLYGGLRNSEVRRAQRDWLQERAGACWIVVRVSKSARGVRWVPLSPAIFAEIKAVAGDPWLLAVDDATTRKSGNITARRRLVERDLSEWLQAICPDRLPYDLRRQAGSVVLDAQGIEAARDFLGHKSADTTRRWYASRISALKPITTLAPAAQPLSLP